MDASTWTHDQSTRTSSTQDYAGCQHLRAALTMGAGSIRVHEVSHVCMGRGVAGGGCREGASGMGESRWAPGGAMRWVSVRSGLESSEAPRLDVCSGLESYEAPRLDVCSGLQV